MLEANRIGGRHGLGMSDQSKTVSSKRKAVSMKHQVWRCCTSAYERLVTGIHNEDTIELYHAHGCQLGRFCIKAVG